MNYPDGWQFPVKPMREYEADMIEVHRQMKRFREQSDRRVIVGVILAALAFAGAGSWALVHALGLVK